jgi:hypothetical protein
MTIEALLALLSGIGVIGLLDTVEPSVLLTTDRQLSLSAAEAVSRKSVKYKVGPFLCRKFQETLGRCDSTPGNKVGCEYCK